MNALMADDDRRLEKRRVEVDDPSLSPTANRALTESLQEALGTDTVRMPADQPTVRMKGGTSPWYAELASYRLGLVITLVMLLVVGAIVSVATDSWWFLIVAAAVHALGTLVVGAVVLRTATAVDKPDPSTVALLEEEGVPDAEMKFNDLMEQFASAETADENARSATPEQNQARSSVEQRDAQTPSDSPSAPSGDRSAVDLLPWFVVAGVLVTSVGVALIVGGENIWVGPAVLVPLCAAWLIVNGRMESAHAEEGDPTATGGSARVPGKDSRGARRLAVLGALVVISVAAFVAVMVLLVV